jgi:excisionase family DNA binding protein
MDSRTPTTTRPSAHRSETLLKAPEAAALLRINTQTLYELNRRGEIPGAIRLGRLLRFSRPALMRLILGEDAEVSEPGGTS